MVLGLPVESDLDEIVRAGGTQSVEGRGGGERSPRNCRTGLVADSVEIRETDGPLSKRDGGCSRKCSRPRNTRDLPTQ
jgi:hypothetical protein